LPAGMSCSGSYDEYYDEEEEEYSESESETPQRPRRREKAKKKEKGRDRRKKDKKEKRHSKRDKGDKGDKEKRGRKKDRAERGEKKRRKEKERGRKRRREATPSSYSGSESPARAAPRRGASPPRRGGHSPRRGGGGGHGGGYGGYGGYGGGYDLTPAPAALCAPRSPYKMPSDGHKLSLAEACEAAGRGMTTGQTAQDDEVKVYNPEGDVIDADRFEEFDDAREFPRELRDELKKAGFPAPSQIQAYTWPLGLKGKDIIGIAATGSGKTLAFLLPAFTQMDNENHRPERDGPGLLVMSPTRELAQQTEAEASRFGKCMDFRCVAMYGGAPKNNQMSKYRQGVHTIVACPGRLNDFLEGGQVRLECVKKLVLDEADRMLDMGFEPQIRKILAKLPRKRHTLFFTATWPHEVRQLASEILTRPYKVMIGNRDELKGNQDITQEVRVMDGMMKGREMERILREAGFANYNSAGKCLVFCNTKRMCEQLSRDLARQGLPCTSIHGDKDQRERDDALNGLKTGRFKVLVATDVAARGLDIKGVGLVVNFDPANNAEDYVHRIGRTARAGAKGFAVTFLTNADGHKARGIVEVMERTDQYIADDLRRLAGSAPMGKGRQRGGRDRGGKGGGGKGFGGGRRRSPSRGRSLSY